MSVQQVSRAFGALKIIGRRKEIRSEVRRACNIYSPKDILQRLSEMSHRQPSLFQEIVEGTGYSEKKFDQVGRHILEEVKMAALLAKKCLKWTYPADNLELLHHYRSEITQDLSSIEAEFVKAGYRLREDFHDVVQKDMHEWLQHTTERRYSRNQSASYIYSNLAKNFPFMEWVIMQYDFVPSDDFSQHAHNFEGTFNKTTWFLVSNENSVVVAYAADKLQSCNWFSDRVDGRTLEQLFYNPGGRSRGVEDIYL
uniref:Uncharacterized protein n=1 Tax=Plectus sambesii TaxID=2011161 RepID=A0A914VKF8_9BILA